eukprot:11540262-Alexandrium_andersonii.AAC.1
MSASAESGTPPSARVSPRSRAANLAGCIGAACTGLGALGGCACLEAPLRCLPWRVGHEAADGAGAGAT